MHCGAEVGRRRRVEGKLEGAALAGEILRELRLGGIEYVCAALSDVPFFHTAYLLLRGAGCGEFDTGKPPRARLQAQGSEGAIDKAEHLSSVRPRGGG